MNQQRMALKNPTGWFAAGREVTRAMALLSDGAFKVYMHVCLTADRSSGRLKIAHGDLATALKKSRRSIVNYLEERRYVALLNGTVLGPVAGLSYFKEVRSLRTSEGYWQHLSLRVAKLEQQWVGKEP